MKSETERTLAQSVPELLQDLEHVDRKTRRRAVMVLSVLLRATGKASDLKREEVIRGLGKCLEDPDRFVRLSAARLLRRSETQSGEKLLQTFAPHITRDERFDTVLTQMSLFVFLAIILVPVIPFFIRLFFLERDPRSTVDLGLELLSQYLSFMGGNPSGVLSFMFGIVGLVAFYFQARFLAFFSLVLSIELYLVRVCIEHGFFQWLF